MKRLEALSRLFGEFTFGMTGTPFTVAGHNFEFNSHEANLYAMGFAGGKERFRVRTLDNRIVTLDRAEMAEWLVAAYDAVAPRIEEYAAGRAALATTADGALDTFDARVFWARRSPALIKIEKDTEAREAKPAPAGTRPVSGKKPVGEP